MISFLLNPFYFLLFGVIYLCLQFLAYKVSTRAFFISSILLFALLAFSYLEYQSKAHLIYFGLYGFIPLFFSNILFYVFLEKEDKKPKDKYTVSFLINSGNFIIDNVKRGVAIFGSAGSGKTESVLYNLLKHFSKNQFSGIIHDYKDMELTEIAYPLYKEFDIPFYTFSPHNLEYSYKMNPIAPRYMETEADVNEFSRVLLENLLEKKESGSAGGSERFFNDAAEGLIGALIWRLKSDFPQYCTIPHLIMIFNFSNLDAITAFLKKDDISAIMAKSFIFSEGSERTQASILSTLANAFKKITSKSLFMLLSSDDIPLDINSKENKAVISFVNHPKYETAYAPILSAMMHTTIKQMSIRDRESSFIMMEEAPTIRLLNMQRVPATLRSYDICTIYVVQDKIQNDILYGDKQSKAIFANLSYQFFGKVNDPDSAKYYERFFEIIKEKTRSYSSSGYMKFDTRHNIGEKDTAKIKAYEFFTFKPGQFVTLSDGKDKKVNFKLASIIKERPKTINNFSNLDLDLNFSNVKEQALSIIN